MDPSPASKISATLAALWQRKQPELQSRLLLLDHAAQALDHGNLTPTQQAEALSVAHQLAGTLGMFGYPAGTDLARQIEQALASRPPTPITAQTTQLRLLLFPT